VEESEVKAHSARSSGAVDTATPLPRTYSLGLRDNWKPNRCGNQVIEAEGFRRWTVATNVYVEDKCTSI